MSLNTAEFILCTVLDEFERCIQLKELELVKLPYASRHVLTSGFISVHNKLGVSDKRQDDYLINRVGQLEYDSEPPHV